MGQRGPLRNPQSRRGQAEIRKRQREQEKKKVSGTPEATKPECIGPQPVNGKLPTPPECFDRVRAERFQNMVMDLAAGGVPLERIDAITIADAVRVQMHQEECDVILISKESSFDQRIAAMRQQSTSSKDLDRLMDRLGGNPSSRARIGLKGEPKKEKGPLAMLLEVRAQRNRG